LNYKDVMHDAGRAAGIQEVAREGPAKAGANLSPRPGRCKPGVGGR